MRAGEVLFQDDVEKSPAKKTPKHWSGTLFRPWHMHRPFQRASASAGHPQPGQRSGTTGAALGAPPATQMVQSCCQWRTNAKLDFPYCFGSMYQEPLLNLVCGCGMRGHAIMQVTPLACAASQPDRCMLPTRLHSCTSCEGTQCMWHAAVVGDQPCQQMVIQVGNRKPEVDKPGVL